MEGSSDLKKMVGNAVVGSEIGGGVGSSVTGRDGMSTDGIGGRSDGKAGIDGNSDCGISSDGSTGVLNCGIVGYSVLMTGSVISIVGKVSGIRPVALIMFWKLGNSLSVGNS